MNVDVGRIRVTCRAGAGDHSRALEARTRAAAAARALPAALDRALHGQPDRAERVVIDRLDAPLDFDLLSYDAETIAALWADRIQAALRGALAAPAPAAPRAAAAAAAAGDAPPPADPANAAGGGGQAPQDEHITSLARQLLGCDPPVLARVALLLGDHPRAAAHLERRLSPDQRSALARALRVAATSAGSGAADSEPDGAERPQRRWASTPAADRPGPRADGEQSALEASWRAAARAAQRDPGGSGRMAAAERLAAAIRATAEAPQPRELGSAEMLITRAGGLALLYPWLGEHLAAAAAASDLAPVDARRLALAAVADERDPLAQHDPLVRLLAGAAPDAATAHIDGAGDAAAADRLLRGFARLLGGLESSTPDWLRAQLIRRPGWIDASGTDADDETTVIRLAPAPFDPLILRLPYPLGAFRLPWTPALQLRIEGG